MNNYKSSNKFNADDWELVKEEPKKNTNKFNPDEWEAVNDEPEQQEGLGKSLAYAPFRVGKDLLSSTWQGLQKIPEMIRTGGSGDQQLQGLSDLLNQRGAYANPEARKHAAKQAFAGINEQINNLAQTPRSLANYGENRLNLLPKGSEEFVGKHLVPEDTTQAINQLFGKPENPGEDLLRGYGRNALNLAALGQVPGIIKNLPHLTKKGASKKLVEARRLGNERNMGPLNVNPELIEDASKFLPDILQNRRGFEGAHYGDYNSLFDLQSRLGKVSSKLAKSWFSPEANVKGEAGLKTRRNLLKEIKSNLESMGNEDIAKLLTEGQNDYRRYMKFKPYRNALALAAVSAAIPKNHLTNLAGKLLSIKSQ